ncbi:FixH family protein [Simplicispira suum]|uniref:Nitrogen fixation protein FixH n=1 Tax=Simplicispira suum TaxID=2109915 RepID=A0A2S0N2C6_9BURK|nr:FixH family protein [Simplicispira suum]AVO42276.1 nitrogen fixation protein FixH [Simplicispira suum]MBW7831691.1 FixH family protein [Simplicispira suum]
MNNSPMSDAVPPKPWWKFGFVWLVIGGPAVVVVASFVTLWLAIRTPDPVIDENYYQNGIAINKTLEAQDRNLAPAIKARNHAATPDGQAPR